MFGSRMRALAKVFYRAESRGKIPCQGQNPRAKTWLKIWMTGLNPNYDTKPIPSLQNSQNKCQKSSFTYDCRRQLISAITASARPPNFEYTHLLLRSADWWRHNILFSIARTIWILNECKLSTDNHVNYQDAYYAYWLITWWLTMKIVPICLLKACKRRKFKFFGDSSQVRAIDSGITCCYWSASLSNRLRALKAHSSFFKCCEKNCPNYMYWIQGKHRGSWI